jgi:hypothetical protein
MTKIFYVFFFVYSPLYCANEYAYDKITAI